jgi:hypothetical protein
VPQSAAASVKEGMNLWKSTGLLSKHLVLGFSVWLVGVQLASPGHRPTVTSGVFAGNWSDSCPCNVPCPCWKHKKSNAERCVNVQAYIFNWDSAKPKAFILVGVPASPHLAPSDYILYVDSSIPDSLVTATLPFFASQYGIFESNVRKAIVKITTSRRNQTITIPSILSYRIESGRNTPVDSSVSEFLYPWLSQPEQWVSKSIAYRGPDGESIGYHNTNALSAKFDVTLSSALKTPSVPLACASRPVAQEANSSVRGAPGSRPVFGR